MKFLYVFFIFLFSNVQFAQFSSTKVISVNDGLLSNNIQSSFTDSDNNIWLGSRAGLFLKNGNLFEKAPQATKYKFNNVFSIIEDPKKGKWVAGLGQGVLFFNETTSKLINVKSGLLNNRAYSLFYYNDSVYVGTFNGISIISVQDFSVTNPRFHQHKDYEFQINHFFNIGSKVYAAVLNDGIFEVTPNKLIKVSDLKRIFTTCSYNNNLLLATQHKLYEVNTTNFEIIKAYDIPNVKKFYKIKNDLYFISSGLFENNGRLFQLKNNEIFDRTNDLNIPFNDLITLTYDRVNDFLYLGTNANGLVQINFNAPVFHQNQIGSVFTINAFNKQQFIFHDQGFSIFEDNRKIKTIELDYFKKFQQKNDFKFKNHAVIKNHFFPIDYQIPANKIIFYHSEINNKHIWVSSNVGMFELDLHGNLLSYHPIHVYYFTILNNKIVAAVPYAGVRVFHDIHNMKYDYNHDWKNAQIPTLVVSIAKTENAVYFASALNGLFELKNGKYRSLLLDKSFLEAKIKRICSFQNDKLAVVTDYNDVYILDLSEPKIKILKHISYDKIKGSSTNFLHEINGVLYIGTNEGINVFKNNKYYFIDKSQGFKNFNSVMATHFGNNLFIATNQGFYEINNNYFEKNFPNNDHATIHSILINNQILSKKLVNNQLILSHNENNIQLFFSVRNAKYPDKLKFAYRLKENEPWKKLTNENQIQLNYLKNDQYNIQLLITNEDTGNTTTQDLLSITVKPPFYYTFPFIIGCFFLVLILVILVYKWRLNLVKEKQKQKLAWIELQNEQEKKELLFDKQLADVKLQALKSQMNSHFLFNVLNSIQYFIICKDVDNALYYLEQFSKLIRKTLAYSDMKNISLFEEINYLKQYIEIENLRTEHPIDFIEDVEDNLLIEDIKISPLLLQPFIENAIVHAFPESIKKPIITLKVEKKIDSYKITLTDNGIGYKEKKSSAHQSKGISIVEKRLVLTQKKLKKPIEISSSPNGTKIILYVD